MARLLAMEWDGREVRLAVAQSQGPSLTIEHALAWPVDAAGDGSAHAARLGARIAKELAALGIRRGEALIAIGRANIELKELELPPAPDDELPDMVRFQAVREFHSLGEDWPLDFVPLNENPAEPRRVLAATVDPELVAQIRQAVEAAGLTPRRLVLRPAAAASLLRRRRPECLTQVELLVDVLTDEADLSVLDAGRVVFMRTVRLAADPLGSAEDARQLLTEIRRTLAAAHNQLGGRRVESIALCGAGADHDALARSIEQELTIETRLFNPFDGCHLSRQAAGALPDRVGRFTPLIGMLVDEASDVPPVLDFFHPRRRPEAPNRRKPLAWAAGIAAALVLLIAAGIWWSLASLDNEILAQGEVSKNLDAQVKRADDTLKKTKDIEKWTNTAIVWLDEFRELARAFPRGEDGMLTGLQVSGEGGGGALILDGRVREPAVMRQLQERLSYPGHRFDVTKQGQIADSKRYRWEFDAKLVVSPRPAADYRARAAAEVPAAPPASAASSAKTEGK